MNKLVEKLESQKARLPLEDYPIIDWAVSAIRIRMQQKEELMDEIEESVNKKVTQFIQKCGKNSNPQVVYTELTKILPIVISEASVDDCHEVAKKGIHKIKNYMGECFKNDKDSVNKIFHLTSIYCDDVANEIETKINLKQINESEIIQAQNLLNGFRRGANDFRLY